MAVDLTFDPRSITTFAVSGWDVDGDVLSLRYALDDLEFVETFTFPPGTAGGGQPAFDLLALVAGVSYFKAADPPVVEVNTPLGPAARALAQALYGPGLGEFRAVNGRPVDRVPHFTGGGGADAPARGLGDGVLVPVGGGKDSVVTVEALRRAGHTVELFSVGDPAAIRRCVEVSGLPRTLVTRKLDGRLLELNRRGALNGHVPATAIVSLVAVAAALARGHGAVALSNERSADVGSFERDGIDVNHQFSKGWRAEQLLRAAIHEAVAPDLAYFSLLRPASELAIARAFAGLTGYHHAFTSCNAAFRLDEARRATSWCCDCPKCRFVFLILAPWVDPTPFFGADLLADRAQLGFFEELAGMRGTKPFECVGEVEEARAAIGLLAQQPRWAQTECVKALAGSAVDAGPYLAPAGPHAIPARFQGAFDALLGA